MGGRLIAPIEGGKISDIQIMDDKALVLFILTINPEEI